MNIVIWIIIGGMVVYSLVRAVYRVAYTKGWHEGQYKIRERQAWLDVARLKRVIDGNSGVGRTTELMKEIDKMADECHYRGEFNAEV